MRKKSRSPVGTSLAKSSETFYPISKRDTFENLPKRSTIAVSVESYKIHMLAMRIDCILTEGNKFREELCFVYNDD